MTLRFQSANETSVRTIFRTSSQGRWARHRLVALIAISFICGCTSKPDDSGSHLSDAELFKLNLQCREVADRHAKDSSTTFREYAEYMGVGSSQYSRKYRRCLAIMDETAMEGTKLIWREKILIDPVSKKIFARSTTSYSDNKKTHSVDRTMTGAREGNPFSSVSDKEFSDFVNRALSEP